MIEIGEAKAGLLESINEIGEIEAANLYDCLGRVLAENIIAPYNNPPFNRSPLDGYAIKGEDTVNASFDNPVKMKVTGKIFAGQTYEGYLENSQAVRIMTGAMIPEGANAVIRQEDTSYRNGHIEICKSIKPYDNFCYAGEDYKKGEILAQSGTYIHAGVAAIIASAGLSTVKVYKRPEVSVIATGDELMKPGEKMQNGKIFDANLTYITSRLRELSIPVTYRAHVDDDANKLADIIKKQTKHSDLIITTGGVSVGEKDIIHEVVKILDGRLLFWKVKIKPGTPVLAFTVKKTLVICLSGNPFGAIANFEILVRPVLAKLSRNTTADTKVMQAKIIGSFDKSSKYCRFVRGHYENNHVHIVNGNHSSGAVSSMAHTNCLIEIKPEMKGVRTGDTVNIYLLSF